MTKPINKLHFVPLVPWTLKRCTYICISIWSWTLVFKQFFKFPPFAMVCIISRNDSGLFHSKLILLDEN